MYRLAGHSWLAAVPARAQSDPGMFCSVPYRFYAPRGLLRVVLAIHNLWLFTMASRKTGKRNDLSLALKYEVLKTEEREKKLGVRKLSEMFGCGKTRISVILKNGERIKELYEANVSGHRCQTGKRFRESKFSELNDTLYSWYLLAVLKNIFPDGSQLAENAREIARWLGVEDFKASNGWLDRWRKKHHLRKMTISGESGEVSGLTVDSWKERLPDIMQGYSSEDVWNLDKTGGLLEGTS